MWLNFFRTLNLLQIYTHYNKLRNWDFNKIIYLEYFWCNLASKFLDKNWTFFKSLQNNVEITTIAYKTKNSSEKEEDFAKRKQRCKS